MVKIKSGGGPRKAKSTKKANKTSAAAAAKFRGLVEDENTDPDEKARQVRSALLDELLALAEELQDGDMTNEEATRRFAGLVVKDRFDDPGTSEGGKKMVDTIGDMVENDPNFVSQLAASLKKLSKK